MVCYVVIFMFLPQNQLEKDPICGNSLSKQKGLSPHKRQPSGYSINKSEQTVLLLHLSINFHGETEAVDESACVSLVVYVVSLESSYLRIVEGEG